MQEGEPMSLARFRERVAELRALKEVAQNDDERLKKEIESLKQERKEIMEDKEREEKIGERLMIEKEDLEQRITALSREMTKLRKKVSESTKENEESRERWMQQHKRVTDILGLRITSINPQHYVALTRYEFTNIDKSDPERVFSVTIKVKEDYTISIERCEPMIKSGWKGLRSASQRLNEIPHNADWHSFIVWIRKQFQELAVQ